MLFRITLTVLFFAAPFTGALANGGRCDVCGLKSIQANRALLIQPAPKLSLITPSIPIPPPVRGR
jgi:hypothetical protein